MANNNVTSTASASTPFSTEMPELLQSHLDHLRASAISIEVIRERGYRSILGKKELVDLGLSEDGTTFAGIPVLHEVFHLDADTDAESWEPAERAPDGLAILTPEVALHATVAGPTEEIRQSTNGMDSSSDREHPEAESVAAATERPSGMAAVWGLLRGFAGTRFRGRDQEV